MHNPLRHPERSAEGAQSKGGLAIGLAIAALLATFVSPQCASAASAPIVQPPQSGTPWTPDGIAKLDGDLDAMLANDPALRGAHFGVYAVDTATGTPLFSHNLDDEIQPASTFKLVVGSAALDRLDPQFVWTTTARLSTEGPANLGPALTIVAVGDPTLASSDLVAAVAALPAEKIVSARIDDSAYDDRAYATGWTWDDFGEDYAPSVSAATLDENVIDMRVSPGMKAGSPAHVSFPDGRPMRTSFVPCDGYAAGSVSVLSQATTGAPGSEDTIDASQSAGRCPEVIGSIPLGSPSEAIAVSMFRPILNMHDVLVRALVAKKTEITTFMSVADDLMVQTVRAIPNSSPPAPFWTHSSKSLSALLGPSFWIPSDNLFGELLLKQIGLAVSGKPGTTDHGIAYEKTWLQSIGIDPKTVTLADACGMSQYDRITPHDLVTILQHDWNGPNRQLVLDSLPVGGARGTIEGISGTDAAGRVFAKTGSMMHVRGLAGYLAPLHHGAITFAFQVDDWNGDYPPLAALRARVLSRLIDD